MNAPLRKLALACGVLFLVLLVNANIVQVGEAKSLNGNTANRRVQIDEFSRQRGDIVVDGDPVALSDKTNDKLTYLRVYPGGSLFAPVTGYDSLTLGTTGVERSADSVLSGSDSRLSFSLSRLTQLLQGGTPQGGKVTLTLDRAAQQVAAKALGDRRGAVVALDPRTGAVLALVTSPSYDPSMLTSHSSATIGRNYKALLAAPGKPLIDRATAGLYPPGSTFKLVTLAAALSSGKLKPDSLVASPRVLDLPDSSATLPNFGGESCGGTSITLTHALEVSCNTAFANVGLTLGANALRAQAQAFGFGQSFGSLGVANTASRFPNDLNAPQTAQSAIGQFDVQTTPLQMALVAAAIADGGTMMAPYLVAKEQAPDLKTLSTAQPKVLATPINPTVAREMTAMMVDVVNNGTGTAAQLSGVQVAGKTGTAENPGEGPQADSWFVSFAPADKPTVALAVLVEQGGGEVNTTGGAVAAPIAKQVLSTLLGQKR